MKNDLVEESAEERAVFNALSDSGIVSTAEKKGTQDSVRFGICADYKMSGSAAA